MDRIAPLLGLLLTMAACGDDDSPGDSGADAAVDGGGDGGVEPDLGLADGGADASTTDACVAGCDEGLGFPEEWSVMGDSLIFSSPTVIDVDGDGVFEIAVGSGLEGTPEIEGFGVVTVHDADGDELWRVDTRDEMVGTVLAVDLDDDGLDDVVAGGRNGVLVALRGTDGALLWEFMPGVDDPRDDGWFNFYSPVELPDLNDDGVPEILAANGGDARLLPGTPRPPSHLIVFDGSDGTMLASPLLPDGRETYCSPLIHRERPADPLRVIVGTGGETAPGSLWSFTLDQVMTDDLASGLELVGPGASKGVIAPPSFADLDGDDVQDLVVATFDGELIAISGATHDPLWSIDVPGHETYVSPVIAELDATSAGLEVYVSFYRGTFPEYDQSRHFVVAGASGAVRFDRVFPQPFAPSAVAADLDDDGQDELLFATFDWSTGTRTHHLLDDLEVVAMETEVGGGMPTPWLGDLDGDGDWELIEALTGFEGETPFWVLRRRDVGPITASEATWPSYLPFGRHP